MKIVLATPANLGKQTGNSITAVRWASILRDLGHQVSIINEYNGELADLMIALNAYRSRSSILKFKNKYPQKPLIVALTGTDLYRFLNSHKKETLNSIEAADRLLVLSNMGQNALPADQLHKVFTIIESAKALPNGRHPVKRYFDICIIGHLRHEKDSLLTAKAIRNLPDSSKIRIRHYGKAHTKEWADEAKNEMLINHRYKWYGEVPHWKVRKALSKCSLLVQSSRIEGGPNSLSEAVVAGVPIISTEIDGCVGVIGKDYPGYFPVGDAMQLRELLMRAETDSKYLESLENYITKIRPRFSLDEEVSKWSNLLQGLFEKI